MPHIGLRRWTCSRNGVELHVFQFRNAINMISRFCQSVSLWWISKCGGREVLWIAIPLIISSGTWAIMNFADRVFLTWYNPIATGATLAAGSYFFVIVAIPFGIMTLTNAFVSQYYGAGQHQRIGPAVWQGVFLSFLLIPIYILAEPMFASVFTWFNHEPELVAAERQYLRISIYSVGALVANEALQAFFIGRGKMHVVMVISLISLLLNVVLDYCWIFGLWGFPEWGIAGAAAATTVSIWVKFLLFLAMMCLASGKNDKFHVWRGFKIDTVIMKRLLWFGIPAGLEFVLEHGCFTMFSLLVGTIGKDALAATSIAFSLNALSFMPIIGMGLAVMSMVGNELGRNRPDLASKAAISALIISLVSNMFLMIFYVFFPGLLIYAYTAYSNPEDIIPIRDMTIVILRFVAVYLLFDGISLTFMSVIKGAGDTFFLLAATLIMAPILPLACYIGIKWYGLGLYGCWTIMTIWICLFAMIFIVRFWSGRWKTKRVIEPELL